MSTTNSLAGGKSKKAPFYHIAHPYDAYTEGYNTHIGQMHDGRGTYDAYSYYLPMEVVKLIPVLYDYFNTLIVETKIHAERQRRKNHLSAIDIAVSTLDRIDHMNKSDSMVSIGSRHLKPITWAVIGKGTPTCRLYKFQFHSIYSLIDHYARRYTNPCHCHPVCVYHHKPYRDIIGKVIQGSPAGQNLSANAVLAASIHFMADLLEHAGPDCTEFFDLFTNDLTCSPDDVDLPLWRRARDKALYANQTVHETPQQRAAFSSAGTFSPPPPPPKKPTRVKVTITNEGDDLTKNAKTTKFQAIVITKPDANYYYYYY